MDDGEDYSVTIRQDGRLDVPVELTERAQRIRELVGAARSCIIEIGRELIAAKAKVGHGNWESWLKAEFGWKATTAQMYVRVYETFSKTTPGVDLETISLSIESKALYALAAPSVPQQAREQALVVAAAGDVVTHADAERMVQEATREAVASIPEKIEALRKQERERAEQANRSAIQELTNQIAALKSEKFGTMMDISKRDKQIANLQQTIDELQASSPEPQEPTLDGICDAVLKSSGQKKLSGKQYHAIAIAINSTITVGSKSYLPAWPEENRVAEETVQTMQTLLSHLSGIVAAPTPSEIMAIAKAHHKASLRELTGRVAEWATQISNLLKGSPS